MSQQISPKHLPAALRWPALRIVAMAGVTLLGLAGASTASAADPACCAVTSIAKSGEITAKETKGARTFQFQVADPALRRGLRVGSPVYANFDTQQVSLDGKKPCCTIVNLGVQGSSPMGATASAATSSSKKTKTGGGLDSIKPDTSNVKASEGDTAMAIRGRPPTPCCGVTAIAKSGQITAQETNGTRTFQFQVADPALRRGLRVGAPVYANFDTKQVSLDGKKSCCAMLNIFTAAPKNKPSGATAPTKQTTTVQVPKVDVTASEGSTATAIRGRPATPTTAAKQQVPGQSPTAISPSAGRSAFISWFSLHGGRFHASTDPNRPAILLIHGLHSSADAWTSPGNDPSVGGYYYDHRHEPPRVKLENQYPGVGIYKEGKSERSREQVNENNWFDYLVSHNYTVATWSQPGEKFNAAYSSAEEAFENFVNSTQGPIALLGHSRGGLVIRKLLKEKVLKQNVGAERVRWVITLHSPHTGSELAKGPQILLDEVGLKCAQIPIPNDWLPKVKNMCNELLNELAKRLAEPGSLELTPGGPVLGPLAQGEAPVPGVSYYTFGGTSPTFIRYYLWWFTADSITPHTKCEDNNPFKCKVYYKWEAVPHAISSISPMYDVVRDVVPEITPGYGDGLVADARARLPFATHAKDSLNHAEVLWNRPIQQKVVQILSGTKKLSPVKAGKQVR